MGYDFCDRQGFLRLHGLGLEGTVKAEYSDLDCISVQQAEIEIDAAWV